MNKNILASLFLIMSTLLVSSCLKDQDDVFDKSASIRSTEYLKNARKVLTSSENGWVMNYYPDNLQGYGGFSYVLKFDDQKVTAYFVNGKTDAAGVPQPETSTYSMTNEDGPCLSFDTYNSYLHNYATPSAGAYEAMGGDFIFIILNISDDENTITLKGTRSGNLVRLYRNTMAPAQYIIECKSIADTQLYETFEHDGLLLELDMESQQATITAGEESEDRAFIITNKGIRLYEPVTIGGKTYDTFTYNADNNTYTSDQNQGVVMAGRLPDGWRSYEDLAGQYTVGTSTITIKTNNDGETYSITGLVEDIDGTVTASYKFTKGSFVLSPQYVGMYAGKYYIWLLAYGDSGLAWDSSIQFKGKNSATDPLTITFSNSSWSTFWAGAFTADPPTGDSYAGYWQQFSDPLEFKRID